MVSSKPPVGIGAVLNAYRKDVRRGRLKDPNRTANDLRPWFNSLHDNRTASAVTNSGKRDRNEKRVFHASRRINTMSLSGKSGGFDTLGFGQW
jgi:hypothetical protein